MESLLQFSHDHLGIGPEGPSIPLLCLSSSDFESLSEMFFSPLPTVLKANLLEMNVEASGM